MEIKYSIFNSINLTQFKLTFRIIINKDDYILINQLPSDRFSGFITVNENLLVSFENFKEDNEVIGNKLLHYFWSPEQLEQVETTTDGIFWQTVDYVLVKKYISGSTSGTGYIDKIKGHLLTTMIAAKNITKDDSESCYEKTEIINYMDS